jgi:hypothetical protein
LEEEERLRLEEEERLREEEETCLQKEGGFPGSQRIKKHDQKSSFGVHVLPACGVDCVTKLNHTKSAVNFNLST